MNVFDINCTSDELLEQLSSVHYILNLDEDKKRKRIETLARENKRNGYEVYNICYIN